MVGRTERILIVRTDRIGDVVLSTPVIKVLRDAFPCAHIAMMVSPFTQELVRGNPYLDEVIIYDKDDQHRGVFSSLKFAFYLRRKKFDLAVILHTTNRVNITTFLAGIKNRVGYCRRLGFLLTTGIPYCKYKGEKHEVEYNLDLLRFIGIKVSDSPAGSQDGTTAAKGVSLFIPEHPQSEIWADDVFRSYGIKAGDISIVLHPSASCLSRMWPIEKFVKLADCLIKKYDARIIIIAGINDVALAGILSVSVKYPVVNLAGKTTLMQLASILRRATLMISNDSGPVHIAVGCGLPVVVLFGRSQPGISPLRWGPRGRHDVVLHKKVGCTDCFAHNCLKEFACLKSIEIDDVLKAVDGIMKVC